MEPNRPLVVTDIQAEIERRAHLAGPEPPFYQLDLRRLIPTLEAAVRVEPSPPLLGRNIYEQLWAAINRTIRRIVRPGVEPAVTAQNELNVQLKRSLDRLIAGDAALHAEIARLRAEAPHGRW